MVALAGKQFMAHVYGPSHGGNSPVDATPDTSSSVTTGPFTATVRPSGAGSTTGWSPGGAGTSGVNWSNVNEAVADDLNAYVGAAGTNVIDLYATNAGLASTAVITQVEIFARLESLIASGNLCSIGGRTGGTNFWDASQVNPTTSFVNYSRVFATNPVTGLAWTYADVNALQIGCREDFYNGSNLNNTQMYFIVTYNTVIVTVTPGDPAVPGSPPDSGDFIRAWPDLSDLPSFRWQINGGPESLKMTLPRAWGSSGEVGEPGSLNDLQMENQIDIYVVDEDTSGDGRLIYRGYIEQYDQVMPAAGVPVTLIPYTSLFQDTWIEGPLVFTNTDPTNMMQSIIETYVPGVTWDTSNPLVGLTFNQTIQDMKVTAAMELIRRLAGSQWYWRLNPDNSMTFSFYDLLAPATHKLNANHYTNAKFTRSRQDVKTRCFLYGQKEQRADDGTLTQPRIAVVITGANFNSARPRDLVITDTRITDNATALRIANARLEYYRADSIEGQIEIIDNNYDANGYDIESLTPGDTLEFFHPDLTYDWPKYDGNYYYDTTAYYNGVYASLIRGPLVIGSIDYKGTSAIVTLTTRPAGVIEALVGLADKQLLADSAA